MGPTAPLRRAPRALRAALPAALALALIRAPAALADAFTPESGGSINADRIDSLYKVVLVVALIALVAIQGTLVYTLVRFRARRGALAAQTRGKRSLELSFSLGALVVVSVLAVITFAKAGGIEDPAASAGQPLRIDVNGQQYLWRYTYPDGTFSYHEMVVPVDTTVLLDVRSADVAHSWWIPRLGGKVDALPGYTNETWFRATEAGRVHEGQCAELCGRNHADMKASVRVVTQPQYEAWLAEQKSDIAEANKLAGQEAARRAEAAK